MGIASSAHPPHDRHPWYPPSHHFDDVPPRHQLCDDRPRDDRRTRRPHTFTLRTQSGNFPVGVGTAGRSIRKAQGPRSRPFHLLRICTHGRLLYCLTNNSSVKEC
ncbi:hypothetical protein HMI54_013706 [Coelomomyces lativittatus]|nr:hypothetical protein HMI54_013706 [Coelomomyces lativittatus]